MVKKNSKGKNGRTSLNKVHKIATPVHSSVGSSRRSSSDDNDSSLNEASDISHSFDEHELVDEFSEGELLSAKKMPLQFSNDEESEHFDDDKEETELDNTEDDDDVELSTSEASSSMDEIERPVAKFKTMEKKSRQEDIKRRKNLLLVEKELEEDALENVDIGLNSSMNENGDVVVSNEDASLLDVTTIKTRIQNIVMILGKFSKLRDPKIARQQYITLLQKYLAAYYGYSAYLMDSFYHLFPVTELIEFLEASDVPRPVTIRTNTLKTKRRELAQALIQRGVNVEPLDKWSRVGLQVFESPVPIGATPEYLAGHYMLQAAASFLPVLALGVEEDERILDMCAAPGGKSTYISALMKNTGCLFANDISKERSLAISANTHRMGIQNTVISFLDGRQFPGVIGGFDRVLLDAPCSGTGVISKDPSVKVSKTSEDFKLLSYTQKELILAAIDSVDARSKTGAILVYSTCSVNVEENEEIVAYALKKRPNVRLIETGLDFGKNGFTAYRGRKYPKELSLTRRYYPHTHNLDGFFVAKFKKISNDIARNETERQAIEEKEKRKKEQQKQVKQAKRLRAESRQTNRH